MRASWAGLSNAKKISIAFWRYQIRDLVLMRIAYHPAHTRKRRDFLGRALRVTTGHQYFAIRILPVNPADRRPGVGIGRRRHRAGIQHHQRSIRGSAAREAASLQRAFNCSAVGLLCPAAKINYMKVFRHFFIIVSMRF